VEAQVATTAGGQQLGGGFALSLVPEVVQGVFGIQPFGVFIQVLEGIVG